MQYSELRSSRKIAVVEQVAGVLDRAPHFLLTQEVVTRVNSGSSPDVGWSDVYQALEYLAKEGRVEKARHPGLTQLLWAVPGKAPGPILEYALLIKKVERLRRVLKSAPPPVGPAKGWAKTYGRWWADSRQEALSED